MKKDIKKSSYYVWFLGAEEAKGLRGSEYMIPVIKHLEEREKLTEPFKVTLQVSHKGVKIMQNVPVTGSGGGGGGGGGKGSSSKNLAAAKTEMIKHFIPHHAITSVYQEEDIVSCILLLFNPVTKCPVHVHAYRCDSVETAEILNGQLMTLTQRPDNQKKLQEIESRLRAKGISMSTTAPPHGGGGGNKLRLSKGNSLNTTTSVSSDRGSARDSELSGTTSSSSNSDRGLNGGGGVATLYDSLAAELKEKLCATRPTGGAQQKLHAPILLPPRDYDTVHRQKGNLSGIDFRRCLNMNIVGVNGASGAAAAGKGVQNETAAPTKKHHHQMTGGGPSPRTKVGSSGGSSGIGSDHAPSPDQETDAAARFLDNQSSSGQRQRVIKKSDNVTSLVKEMKKYHQDLKI